MNIGQQISAIFKRTQAPAMCECGNFHAIIFFEGRALCSECHQLWLCGLQLADQKRAAMSKTAESVPPAMCECGEFQALVIVDGRGLCFNCHDEWLRVHGLGAGRP